ncbi:hypothetical protein OG786_05655 [Streptomyces sp. NBC_00101]|uniref:hypothetical protein n=1 Tax=Streptomyces sp. NBC_00101 TaxID=2975651 RepID=UPI003243C396
MDAVMETHGVASPTPWPTAAPGADRLLVLSDRMSLLDVGTAMAVLTDPGGDGEPDGPAPGAATGLRRVQDLLDCDLVIAPGGLLLRDTTTGVALAPGCCFGLENWRDWLDLAHGEEIWLGHDGAPRLEHRGTLIRMWPGTGPHAQLPLEFDRAELPGLLRTVHEKLNGFLALAGQWASPYAPALATALMTRLGEDLHITAPLETSLVADA